MDIHPAHVDQIRQTEEGDWIVIPAEAGTVAGELRKIDRRLRVRLSTRGFWAVFEEEELPDGGTRRSLVLTQRAYRNSFGVWEGLDNRVLERVRKIDREGRGNYDFVAEVEAQNRRAKEQARKQFAEKVGPYGEQAAHAIRKDLGTPYRGRVFLPKDLPA